MKAIRALLHTKVIESVATYLVEKLKDYSYSTYLKLRYCRHYVLIIESPSDPYSDLVDAIKNQPDAKAKEGRIFSMRYVGKGGEKPVPHNLVKADVIFKGENIRLTHIVVKPSTNDYAIGERTNYAVHVSTKHSIQLIEEYISWFKKERDGAPVKWCSVNTFDKATTKNLKSFRTDEVMPPVLPEGKLEEIEDDLATFYSKRQWYLDRGIPFRRGYCFEGEPGTGKSSIIQYLAARFHKSIYYVTAETLRSDKLAEAIAAFNNGHFLVIEDIDCLYSGREAMDNRLPPFNEVLNTLDGFLAPKHIVLMITTNRLDVLDKALLRPGRIDKIVNLGHADSSQITRLMNRFFPGEMVKISNVFSGLHTPATIQQLLLESKDAKEFYKKLKEMKTS